MSESMLLFFRRSGENHTRKTRPNRQEVAQPVNMGSYPRTLSHIHAIMDVEDASRLPGLPVITQEQHVADTARVGIARYQSTRRVEAGARSGKGLNLPDLNGVPDAA